MSKSKSAPTGGKEPAAPVGRLAYNRREAAMLLSVSPITLDRLCGRGLIHPSRATRRPIFARIEIERFLRDTAQVIQP